ncbi:MAG: metallophosphoesterase [Xanthomonadales bacterium]|nr:metallophosphoesterase [Xanthomonadales bacterium]
MTTRCHRVAQLTDLHLTADRGERLRGIDVDASARAVIDALRAWRPDLIVATGDLTERGEDEAYAHLDELCGPLDAPVHVLLGNHDDPGAFERAQSRALRRTSHTTLGAWQLHFLDSWLYDSPAGRVGEARLDTLKQTLHTGPAIVFVHHQPVPVESTWIDAMGLLDGTELVDAIGLRSAPSVLCCGHVHQAVAGWTRGLRWLTTPSTCNQAIPFRRTHEPDELRGPGFRWLELYDDGRWETGLQRLTL